MNAAVAETEGQSEIPAVAQPERQPARKVRKPFAADVPFNEPLVHQAVVAWLAGARQGSRAQKNRSAVRGGGAKPWRQKGTGRARAGTRSSPIWVGGGRAFPASPRSFARKINRKMYRGAMRCLLAEAARRQRLAVVRTLAPPDHRTASAVALLEALDFSGGLIVVESRERYPELCLGVRNLPHVDITDVRAINPAALAGGHPMLFTEGAFEQLQERLQ